MKLHSPFIPTVQQLILPGPEKYRMHLRPRHVADSRDCDPEDTGEDILGFRVIIAHIHLRLS